MKEDLFIVGILTEKDVDDMDITLEEVRQVMDWLDLGTFYEPFLANLKEKYNDDENLLSRTFKTLNSIRFLRSVPLFCNARETHLNIKLITSSIILTKKQIMTHKQITEGVRAFTLAGKETKIGERIKLEPSKIQQALRLINKTMSESKMIKAWINMWGNALDCNMERDKTKIEEIYDPGETKYLLPHEFLFLLWNARDRDECIEKTRKKHLNLNKKIIKDFDFAFMTGGNVQIQHKDPWIYMLPPGAFENQAPNSQLK